jgi:hypothetical protein
MICAVLRHVHRWWRWRFFFPLYFLRYATSIAVLGLGLFSYPTLHIALLFSPHPTRQDHPGLCFPCQCHLPHSRCQDACLHLACVYTVPVAPAAEAVAAAVGSVSAGCVLCALRASPPERKADDEPVAISRYMSKRVVLAHSTAISPER